MAVGQLRLFSDIFDPLTSTAVSFTLHQGERLILLILLWHLLDDFGADFSNVHPLVKADKVIEQQEFSVLLSDGAYHVIVQNVLDEVSRCVLGVDDPLPGLLNILHQVCGCVRKLLLIDRLKVVSAEAFCEVAVL